MSHCTQRNDGVGGQHSCRMRNKWMEWCSWNKLVKDMSHCYNSLVHSSLCIGCTIGHLPVVMRISVHLFSLYNLIPLQPPLQLCDTLSNNCNSSCTSCAHDMQPSAKSVFLVALIHASNGWVSSAMGCTMPTAWMFVVSFVGCHTGMFVYAG